MKRIFVCACANLFFFDCSCTNNEQEKDVLIQSTNEYVRNQVTSKKDCEDILKIVENYLNSIEKYRAAFEQFDSKDLSTKTGHVEIIKRKDENVVKLKYDKPSTGCYSIKNKDSKNIVIFDDVLKEQTELSKKALPFSVFLEQKINFKKIDVRSISVDHDYIYINLAFHGLENCELELAFSENPVKLSRWNIRSKEYGNISVIITEEIEVITKEKRDH